MTTPPGPPSGTPNRFAPPNGPDEAPALRTPACPSGQPQQGTGAVPPLPGYAPGTYYAPGTAAATPPVPLDPMAVASVPTGLLGPVGVGLGIAGLVRTRHGRRRGRGLAWIGTALGSVVTAAGITVGIVVAVVMAGWKTLPADVDAPRTVNAVQVTTGNCIDQLPANGQEITGVPVVPCSATHHAQAVGSTTLPDGAFPGAERVVKLASRACQVATGTALPEGAETVVWAPTEASWAEGDRTGLCLVSSGDPLTTSLVG